MNLREKFYDKISKEYDDYIKNLKHEEPEVIINKSYETTIKEEIICYFTPDSEEYSLREIRELNKFKEPLDTLYSEWMDCDLNIGTEIRDCISELTIDLIEKNNQKGKER